MKILYILCLLLVLTQASVLNKRGTGVGISIVSSSDFCLYLPPTPGQSISATENDATAFCHTSRSYAKSFPRGFIRSAHYVRTSTLVQVTGRMNHTAYNIQTEDGGGQYDYKVSLFFYYSSVIVYSIIFIELI